MKWLDTAKDFLDSKGGIILGIVTLVALGGAVACAINDTSKVKEKKEAEEERREEAGEEPMDTKDNIIFYAKAYAPTIVCTTIAAAGIISYVAIGEKKVMALSTACSASDLIAKSYQRAVKETLPEEEAKKVEDAVKAQTVAATSTSPAVMMNDIIVTGTGNDIFEDPWSGRRFYSKGSYLKECMRRVERSVRYDLYATLNEFYEEVGIKTTNSGNYLVWDTFRGDELELDFNTTYHDDILDSTVTVLNFVTNPRPKRDDG